MAALKNIAIIGGTGNVGSPILSSLLARGTFDITAISRPESTAVFPASVKVLKGSYDSAEFMQSALQNQDVFIITLATTAPKDLQPKLIDAAIAVGVKWIVPNEYGPDSSPDAEMNNAVYLLTKKKDARKQIEQSGTSSFIAYCSGLWFDFSLGGGFFGIDILARTARLYDTGTVKLSTSTLPQVGLGVAALFSLPSSALEKFKNGFVRTQSFTVSQMEMLRSVQRATKTTDADWKIEFVPVEEAIEKGLERFKGGDFHGMVDVLYGWNFKEGKGGNFEERSDNELFGLKEEDLDQVVERVVKEVGEGKWKSY